MRGNGTEHNAVTREEFLATLATRAADAERLGALAPVASVVRDILRDAEAVNGWPAHRPAPDRLITLEAAADQLAVTPRWLRETRPGFVVTLGDKTLRVSEQRLARFIEGQVGPVRWPVHSSG